MGKNNEKITKTEQKKGRINKGAAAQLVAGICREKLWATPEETAAWLKTETGQRIAALIEMERKKKVIEANRSPAVLVAVKAAKKQKELHPPPQKEKQEPPPWTTP